MRECWLVCSEKYFLDNNYTIKNILKTLKALDPAFSFDKDNIDVTQLLKLSEGVKSSEKLENFINLYSKSKLYIVKEGVIKPKNLEIGEFFDIEGTPLALAITKILSTATPNLYIKKLFDFVSKRGEKIIIISKSPSIKLLSFIWAYSDIVVFTSEVSVPAKKVNLVIIDSDLLEETQSELKNIFDQVDVVNLTKFFPSKISSVTPLPRLEEIRSSIFDTFILFDSPLIILGKIAKGNSRGAELLGLPTANIISDKDYSYCVPGVYFGYIQLIGEENQVYFTSTSIGYNIHFNDPVISIESYIHHTFDISLVGLSTRLDLKGYIRSESSFDCLESLIETIQNDCNLGNLIDSDLSI